MNELAVYDVRCLKGDSAFLLVDDTTAILYDSGFGFTGKQVAQNIRRVLGERKLDYIFLTHSHYDHAMGSAWIRREFPEAKTVAGSYAASVFQRPGARRVMAELDAKFAQTIGFPAEACPWEDLRVDIPCEDGDVIRAGEMTFRVIALPGHTRCSVAFYCPERKLLLSTETIGIPNGAGGVMPSYLIGYGMTMQSIDRALTLEIDRLLAPHWGLLTREETASFLRTMKPAAVSFADGILQALRAGKSDREILDDFRENYWRGYVREIYPIDAAELNTTIMIGLIRKELLEAVQ